MMLALFVIYEITEACYFLTTKGAMDEVYKDCLEFTIPFFVTATVMYVIA
jgi:hypothetical protein